MTVNSKTPIALYKANLELVLRIGALLQENRRRWAQLGAAGTSEAIERTMAQAERVLTSNDWTSLSALPGDDFWKSLRDDGGPLQGTTEAAVGNQAAFAQGLKEAFEAWQQQSADALGGAGMELPGHAMAGFMKSFTTSKARSAPAPKSPADVPRKAGPKAKAKARPSSKAKTAPKDSKSKARPKAGLRSRSAGTSTRNPRR